MFRLPVLLLVIEPAADIEVNLRRRVPGQLAEGGPEIGIDIEPIARAARVGEREAGGAGLVARGAARGNRAGTSPGLAASKAWRPRWKAAA